MKKLFFVLLLGVGAQNLGYTESRTLKDKDLATACCESSATYSANGSSVTVTVTACAGGWFVSEATAMDRACDKASAAAIGAATALYNFNMQ